MDGSYVIVQGEDVAIPLRIIETFTQDPMNLTDKIITGVLAGCPDKINLPASQFEITNPILGKVTMRITNAQTQLMRPGIHSFELVVTDGTDIKIVQFKNLLEVESRI